MDLKQVRRHWNLFARSNPMWSNLTGDSAWDAEAFFATGETEIEETLQRAQELEVAPARRTRALDFGCGVGRLTQALGRRFDRADGVDIARAMLEEARRYDRSGGRCQYHLNTSGHLGQFESGSFDLVCSLLVLQHMEPGDAVRYIAEMVRVLAPGGLLAFNVPHRVPGKPEEAIALPSGGSRTRRAKALSGTTRRALISPCRDALLVKAGERFDLAARVQNADSGTWPYHGALDERYKITLGATWIDVSSGRRWVDEARGGLPYDLAPGMSTTVNLLMHAPRRAGEYQIELDMVQEGVCWFGERGSTRAAVSCRVDGDGATDPAGPISDAATPSPAPSVSNSVRRQLAGTVLGTVYRAWLRRLAWRRSLQARRTVLGAVMEMHSVPEAEVTAVIEGAGGRVVTIDRRSEEDGVQTSRYWATR